MLVWSVMLIPFSARMVNCSVQMPARSDSSISRASNARPTPMP